jgi:type VI secretion system protein ImpG
MDPRLLKYYNAELQHFRGMSGEFAAEFPKVAGRLGLDSFECADPYVERLIEGFAFLAARVRLKVDAEFPRFTRHLMQLVYPHYLSPTPSMAIVQFQPLPDEAALADGSVVPRDTVMKTLLGKGEQTPCEYRTAHDVTLWPLELVDAEYIGSTAAVIALGVTELQGVRAAIRLKLKTTGVLTFDKLALDSLPLYLRGSNELPVQIYEQLIANVAGMVVRPATRPIAWQHVVRDQPTRPRGFDASEALLPYQAPSFEGYRLLHEYFAFPQRYLFVELTGLGPAVRRCRTNELEVIILLKRQEPRLDGAIGKEEFALFCTPAINLFPRRADRIHLTDRSEEHHVVVDRTRPMDFEVYAVTGVTGFGVGNENQQEFLPFYALTDLAAMTDARAFFTTHREPRLLSSKQRLRGPRSSYIGSEVFVSLVDGNEAPYRHDLRQLGVETLCTNRDLPLDVPIGKGPADFILQLSAPVQTVRCVAGPSKPRPSFGESDAAWRLISHLSLNYQSLVDSNPEQGAAALRELLSLYAELDELHITRQLEGLRSVKTRPVTRRALIPGPIAFCRGLEITVTCGEESFEGTGVFLLGAVLDRFFAKYVSINSFTETVLRTLGRGEIMRWRTQIGQRHTL